jgi:hypothetical protein
LHSFCCLKSTKFEIALFMKTTNRIFLLPLMLLLFTILVSYQTTEQIPSEIIASLKTGNAKVLASFFNQNVELIILNDDNVYSKAQAEQIVSGFFIQNQPEKFTVIHQSGKEGAKYVIGQLTTKQGPFRVTFLLRKTEEKEIIHQLRIDKQE